MSGLRFRGRDSGASRDDGQVVTALVVLLTLGMLFFAVKVILPIGEAVDKRSRAQVAADAAALAAAEQVAEATVDLWALGFSSRVTGRSLVSCDGSYDRAIDYAGANEADLLAPFDCRVLGTNKDQVAVRVQLNEPTEGGQVAQAEAYASLGIDWRACRWVRGPNVPVPTTTTTTTTTTRPPTTVTTTTTTTPPPPPPNPDVKWDLRCDRDRVVAEFLQSGRPPHRLKLHDDDEAGLLEELKGRAHLIAAP